MTTFDEWTNRVAVVLLCNVTSMHVDASCTEVQSSAVDVGKHTAAEVYFFEGVYVGGITSKASFHS